MVKLRETESSVQDGCRVFCELAGARVIRVHQGVMERGEYRIRMSRTGEEGRPDLLAVWPDRPALWIECKAEDGVLEPMQGAWHRVLRAEGYTVLVPRSAEEVRLWLITEGLLPEGTK